MSLYTDEKANTSLTHNIQQQRPEHLFASRNNPRQIFCISNLSEKIWLYNNITHSEFLLISPLNAGASFGIPWWLSVTQEHKHHSILDCGSSAALAHIALSEGIGFVVCFAASKQIRSLQTDHNFRTRILTSRPPSQPISPQTSTCPSSFKKASSRP
ncbi:hypothetical protein [Swingsia samuiensis]|uniref:Uncharacterized protein n=1 Tax=Swingsia samuiensis TaxID=1293412 RepID=A0A4Y6UHQ6_9PROT|nr:hypothetical protein [Swingsia samuiensis]QDH16350.1 hypothetical protein E3D00_01300 [Swingsia samuiensis]